MTHLTRTCILLLAVGLVLLTGTSAWALKEGQILNEREPEKLYETLQDAIDEARIGDTIRVGPGRYTESVKLKEGVTIIGAGKDSSEIISSKGEPTVTAKEVNNGKLEGFTLTYAGDDNQPVVWLVSSNMEITQNRIRNSSVSGIEVENSSGGVISYNEIKDNKQAGIYVHTNSNPFLWRNRIYGNELSGISIGETSSPELEGNQIWNNKQAGIYVWGSSSPKILKNAVWKNAPHGIMVLEGSNPTLSQNRIKQNKDNGIKIEKSANPVVEKNIIHENGGAAIIINENSSPQILENSIAGNSLGIYIYGSSNPVVKLNAIWKCDTHGVMVESNSNPQIINNVIWACLQCGIYITDGSEPLIVNNIIGKNEWGVSNEGNGEFRPRMEKNDVWGNAANYESMEKPPTDLCSPPEFVNSEKGDFRLKPGSSLVKAGKDGHNLGISPTAP